MQEPQDPPAEQNISFREAVALAQSGDRHAQYALSTALYHRGRFDECLHWLNRAAAQHLAPAQLALATLLIDGRRCQRDLNQAIRLLVPLAASDVQASLLLSEVYGFAALGGTDRETSLGFLLRAARMGHADAMRQLALLSVGHQQWHLVRPLLAAAALGSAAASYAYARCDMRGVGDSSAPGPIDWQLLEESIPCLAGDWRVPDADILHQAPLVRRVSGAIDPLLLDVLIHLATPLVQPSKIADVRGSTGRVDPRRNSASVTVSPRQHDHVLEAIERSISRVSGLPVLNSEFLQIIRYRVGEEFKPHVDYFTEGGYDHDPKTLNGAQRAQTVLIYLNDDYQGGSTCFPRLRLEVKGKPGDVLHFHNLNSTGTGCIDSVHAGAPVITGEKWLLSQWIRSKPYPERLAW